MLFNWPGWEAIKQLFDEEKKTSRNLIRLFYWIPQFNCISDDFNSISFQKIQVDRFVWKKLENDPNISVPNVPVFIRFPEKYINHVTISAERPCFPWNFLKSTDLIDVVFNEFKIRIELGDSSPSLSCNKKMDEIRKFRAQIVKKCNATSS